MALRGAVPSGDRYPALRIFAALADLGAWIGAVLLALAALVTAVTGHAQGLLALVAAFLWWLGLKAGADLAQAVLDIADHLRSE